MINNKILVFAIVGILLISAFAYLAKGAAGSTASGYLILMDQKVSTSDYEVFKDKKFESIVFLPSSDCQGYTTSCKYVFPQGVDEKGDINKDGKIDSIDVYFAVKAYDCKSGETCWNSPIKNQECYFVYSGRRFRDPYGAAADDYSDCKMDSNDSVLVINNYGKNDPYALSFSCRNYEVCRADVNQDGKVDIYDVALVNSLMGQYANEFVYLGFVTGKDLDLDGNGVVDIYDIQPITQNFGKSATEQKCEIMSIEHVSGNQWRIKVGGRGLFYVGASYLCAL
jgi:hypothetical protein